MKRLPPIRERWSDGTRGGRGDGAAGSAESRAGALFREVGEPALPGAEALDRVAARLEGPRRRTALSRWLAGAAPIVVVLALLAGRAREPAAPPSIPLTAPPPATAIAAAPAVESPSGAAAQAPTPALPIAPPTVAAPPAPVELHASPRGNAPRARRPQAERAAPLPESERSSAPAPAQPESESDLAAETRLIGASVRSLRQDHDGRAALAHLDEYRARFPRGTLRPEAELARLDTLLFLDRRGEALALLDGMGPTRTVRARELAVLRGELRSEAGRCGEAIADFTRALRGEAGTEAAGARDGIEERARYGRATCLARGGDWAGAREDLRGYLERFPDGRFAAAARQRLSTP